MPGKCGLRVLPVLVRGLLLFSQKLQLLQSCSILRFRVMDGLRWVPESPEIMPTIVREKNHGFPQCPKICYLHWQTYLILTEN